MKAVARVGAPTLIEFLVINGVSVSVASKLVANRYEAKISEKTGRKIMKGLEHAKREHPVKSA
jgi:hypothetical protein